MKKLLALLLLSPLVSGEDDFMEMHLLAGESVWVRDMNMPVPNLSEKYDCGFINENGTYAENVKSSSKRYHYQATGISPKNINSNLRDYLIKTNAKNFYCGFNNKIEAIKAIDSVMLKCINDGWESCLIGGTGDKDTNGWLLGGNNGSNREKIVKEKLAINKNKIQKQIKQKELQAWQEKFMAYIETLKSNCMSYGFSEDEAIATCVQREINLERDRLQAKQIAKQNQSIIRQVQPSYRNSKPNYDALSSMGRCLQNESSFAACSNAWSGYTPKPAKKVYKCDYDTFGNQISSTCREQ